MQKEMLIIDGLPGEGHAAFKRRILDLGKAAAGSGSFDAVKACFTEAPPPALSVIPFRKDLTAVLSFHYKDPQSPKALQDLAHEEGFRGKFLVEEALPVAYTKDWEDGKATPGACLLTLFHQRPGIERDTFMKRWHDGHTPLSLKLHPLWNYNRNVVLEASHEKSPWYDGIVEEQCRTRRELLNPLVFFGPARKVPKHMLAVWKDSRSFIDMKRIETYLCAEYHLLSTAE